MTEDKIAPLELFAMGDRSIFDLLDSRLRIRLRRPVGCFSTELLGVLPDKPLPSAHLHRVATNEAADGSSAEQPVQNIEGNVPTRCAPRDETPIDVGPQRQPRATSKRFEFPAIVAVLKHLGRVDPRHFCFDRRGRSYPGELHCSNRTQAPIHVKGSPLAEMRRVGERLPNLFRRVTQFSHENERPLVSLVLSDLRPAGGTWCVVSEIAHFLLLVVRRGSSRDLRYAGARKGRPTSVPAG